MGRVATSRSWFRVLRFVRGQRGLRVCLSEIYKFPRKKGKTRRAGSPGPRKLSLMKFMTPFGQICHINEEMALILTLRTGIQLDLTAQIDFKQKILSKSLIAIDCRPNNNHHTMSQNKKGSPPNDADPPLYFIPWYLWMWHLLVPVLLQS